MCPSPLFKKTTFLAVLFLVSFIPNGLTQDQSLMSLDVDKGLVLYYPFDGSVKDMSGNGFDGFAVGAKLTNDRFDKKESAFFFDGVDDYIELPKYLDLVDDDYTFSVWIKPNDYGIKSKTSSSCYRAILSYRHRSHADGADINSGIIMTLKKDKGCIGNVYIHSKFIDQDSKYNYSACEYENYEWFLLTTVRRNRDLIIYVNGDEVFRSHVSASKVKKSQKHPLTTIGAHRSGEKGFYNFPFYGVIDEVRLYNRGLSKEEVKMLYSEG